MKIIFTILFLMITNVCHADMWYILDKDENVVAKQNGPVKNDISKDGFFVVKSSEDVELSKAVYRNNKIAERKRPQSEIDAENKLTKDKESALAKFKTLGLTDDEIKAILK